MWCDVDVVVVEVRSRVYHSVSVTNHLPSKVTVLFELTFGFMGSNELSPIDRAAVNYYRYRTLPNVSGWDQSQQAIMMGGWAE